MRIPDYAASDSCIKASKALKKPWGAGLINAVLRQIGDESVIKNNLLVDSEHPLWLFQAIRSAWGEQAETIFSANNAEPPLCLRVNSQKISRDAYMEKLLAQGLGCNRGEHSLTSIYLHDKPKNISDLPGFKEGECSVQDEAPQLSAFLLPLEKGLRVLDACAAPGGKTCHLLETEPQLAQLLAVDIEPGRLLRVQENLQRLHLHADCMAADIAQPAQWWDGQVFDRILCDVPCSATGVIRRHPDIKYLRRAEDIAALSEVQFNIVNALWPTLKPGGFLLYATCSILPQENEHVIARFLASHNDAQEQTLALDCGLAVSHGRQLFPQIQGHDGFYYALLKKSAE
jgi:16S rRNA (cytosine967-C5)-methyltransferase